VAVAGGVATALYAPWLAPGTAVLGIALALLHLRWSLRRHVEGPLLELADWLDRTATDPRGERKACAPAGLERIAEAAWRAADRARRARDRAQRTLDAIGDAVVVIDHRGLVQAWNATAEQMFGHRAHAIVGRNISAIVPEPHNARHDGYLRAYLETGVAKVLDFPRELMARRADGSTFPVLLFVRRVDQGDQPPLFCATIHDRTQQESARADLVGHAHEIEVKNRELAEARAIAETAQAQAEAANRAKSAFLANMSHEIRTPMTAILGYAENLQDVAIDTKERLIAVDTIRRNGEHLLTIINDILDLSKIEAGKMTVEAIPCAPVQIVHEVARLMRVRAESKRLRLTTSFDCPLPARVLSDPTRLRQILINLCGNALKFTELGGIEVRLALRGRTTSAPELVFTVADTGIGMDAGALQRLFRPFEQADGSTTRRFGGTGLGLDISRRLVEMLGGTIRAASQPGCGSTFTFTVPTGPLAGVELIYGVDEEPAPTGASPGPQRPLPRLRGRILLAEDGPDNQRLIAAMLRRAGAEVTVADNGLVACTRAMAAKVAGTPFDLLLLDMQMPVMDGYEAADQLRRDGFDRPIIALTANTMSGDRERCLAAGCSHFAQKPIDRPALFTLLADLLPSATPPVPPTANGA
jgi:PAS domain S-box-containing protein